MQPWLNIFIAMDEPGRWYTRTVHSFGWKPPICDYYPSRKAAIAAAKTMPLGECSHKAIWAEVP